MRQNVVPYTDDKLFRSTVTVFWDIAITRMSGNRWRVLFPVEKVTFQDGRSIKGDLLKIFVLFKNASFFSSFDVRLGFISTSPFRVSKIDGDAIRVSKDSFSNQVSVFFEAFTTDKEPRGVLKGEDTKIDPLNPDRLLASEDLKE